jgi:hypothetical protein
MTRTFTVEVPDEVTLSVIETAVLERVEPGASRHCRRIHWDSVGIVGSTHPRLGVTIKEVR